MTRLEILFLNEKEKRGRVPRKTLLFGAALALALLLFQVGGVWAKTSFPAAVGVLWQDFFNKLPPSEVRRAVHIGISLTKGGRVSFQALEDTPIKVEADGTSVVTRAPFPRIEKILADAGIELGKKDRAEARVVTGEEKIPEIKVIRVRNRIVTEDVPLPYPVKRVRDYWLPPGKTEVRAPGRPGLLLKKAEITTENGVEVARKELGTEVIRAPEPRVIAYGAETTARARRSASRGKPDRSEARRVLKMVATAYTHTGNPTATGVWPYIGGVAVDPDVIPLGSKLYVEGYGPARAVDTGGLIKGNRIDLFFNTADECFAFGKREVDVYVLE